MEQVEFKYFAFISYKSQDVKWAKWLQRRLENYSLPVALQRKLGTPKRLAPIFRDGTDIMPGELKKELHGKLEESKYLILLCSPRSASSQWVGEEIDWFCRMGRRDHIIAVIIDGTPYSDNPDTECYHPILKKWFPKGDTIETDFQLLGTDIHAAGPESDRIKKERAFIQVASTILQLPFDYLWNRRRRYLLLLLCTYLTLFLAVSSAITFTWLYGKPFDVSITINELTPHTDNLPSKGGTLAMVVADNDTIGVKSLTDVGEKTCFEHIPGSYKGRKVHFVLNVYGYQPVDTLVELGHTHSLNVRRDNTFAVFAGQITYDDGVTPADGATVTVDGKRTETDFKGHFEIQFSIPEQSVLKHVIVSKDGYSTMEYDLQPQKDHMLILFKHR